MRRRCVGLALGALLRLLPPLLLVRLAAVAASGAPDPRCPRGPRCGSTGIGG